jgi:hypothetical protein
MEPCSCLRRPTARCRTRTHVLAHRRTPFSPLTLHPLERPIASSASGSPVHPLDCNLVPLAIVTDTSSPTPTIAPIYRSVHLKPSGHWPVAHRPSSQVRLWHPFASHACIRTCKVQANALALISPAVTDGAAALFCSARHAAAPPAFGAAVVVVSACVVFIIAHIDANACARSRKQPALPRRSRSLPLGVVPSGVGVGLG